MGNYSADRNNSKQASANLKKIEKFRNQLRDLKKELNNLVLDTIYYQQELMQTFDDPVADSFKKQFDKVYPNLEVLIEEIDNYSEKVLTGDVIATLKSFLDIVDEADNIEINEF